MRAWRLVAVAAAAALVGAVVLLLVGRRREPPNVIFVCVDALRADHIHAAGYPRETTPNLDRLIGRGVYFRSAYSQYTSTWLSVSSYFSGRHPYDFVRLERRGALALWWPPGYIVPPGFPVMAEYFGQHGYYTAAVVSNPQVTPAYGFARGFEEFHLLPADPDDPERQVLYARADRMNEAVLERYDAALRDRQPFFLYLHYMEPHKPYLAPPPFKGRWREGLHKSQRLDFRNVPREESLEYYAGLTPEDVAYMIACYDEEIRYFDEEFARLLEALEERGALENTVLVLSADHGEQFMEHGFCDHDNACHVEEVHVPLLFWSKRLKPRLVERPVGLVSVWPTLAELVEPDAQMLRYAQGAPLPEVTGRGRAAGPGVVSEGKGSISLRTDTHAYVLYYSPELLFPIGRWRPGRVDPPEVWHQLYRLGEDPAEQNDLFPAERGRAAEMHFALEQRSELAVSRDYWLGEDVVGRWFSQDEGGLGDVLRVEAGQGVRWQLSRPEGAGHVRLDATNAAGEPREVRLRIRTGRDSWYYLAAAYRAAPGLAALAVYDGAEKAFEEPEEQGGARVWRRTLPIGSGEATLAMTLAPGAAVQVDELYAIRVWFLTPPPEGPGRHLDREQRERLRGLGYMGQ